MGEAETARGLDEELTSSDAGAFIGSRPRGKLPPEAEAAIEQARIQNMIVAAIAGCSWGKNMSTPMRRAYADYCRRYDVDPVTEMDNLGGTPYVNADWSLRKLGELRIAGVVKDFYLEHIQADKRLDTLRKDESIPAELRAAAQQKWFDMLMKRIEQNAPEESDAVCVCTIILPAGGTPIRGCKWAGNGTSVMQPRHGGGQAPNPIAENNPTLSVESQSIRRALRQLISHITGSRVTLPNVDAMADELGNLQTRTREATQERTAGVAAAIVQDETVQLDRSNLLTSGYNEAEEFQRHHARRENPDDVAVVSGPVSNRVDRPTLQRIANAPDPYADPPVDRRGDPSELTTEKLNAEVTGDSLDVVKSGDVDPFVDARAPLITPAIRDAQRAENRSFVDELEEQSRDEERFVREMSDALGEPTPGNTLHVAAVASDPQSETTIARASLELTPEPIAYPLRELPKKACFSCGQMVSGPNTSQHDPRCIYYKQPAE